MLFELFGTGSWTSNGPGGVPGGVSSGVPSGVPGGVPSGVPGVGSPDLSNENASGLGSGLGSMSPNSNTLTGNTPVGNSSGSSGTTGDTPVGNSSGSSSTTGGSSSTTGGNSSSSGSSGTKDDTPGGTRQDEVFQNDPSLKKNEEIFDKMNPRQKMSVDDFYQKIKSSAEVIKRNPKTTMLAIVLVLGISLCLAATGMFIANDEKSLEIVKMTTDDQTNPTTVIIEFHPATIINVDDKIEFKSNVDIQPSSIIGTKLKLDKIISQKKIKLTIDGLTTNATNGTFILHTSFENCVKNVSGSDQIEKGFDWVNNTFNKLWQKILFYIGLGGGVIGIIILIVIFFKHILPAITRKKSKNN
jgi:hypothetical protein